jgi:hypothetical protein
MLKLLGLDKVPEDRCFMLNAAARKLAHRTKQHAKRMKESDHLQSVNWKIVDQHMVQVADLHNEYNLAQPLIAAWQEALNVERMSYLEQFEHGELGANASARLEAILSTTLAQVNAIASGSSDQISAPSQEYEIATRKLINEFKIPAWVLRLERVTFAFAKSVATRAIVEQLKTAYEMGAAYLRAHEKLMNRANERQEQRDLAHRLSGTTAASVAKKRRVFRWRSKARGDKRAKVPIGFGSAAMLLAKRHSEGEQDGAAEATVPGSPLTEARRHAMAPPPGENSGDTSSSVVKRQAQACTAPTVTKLRSETTTRETVLDRLAKLEQQGIHVLDDNGAAERAQALNSSDDPLMQVALLHNQHVRRVQKAMDELRLQSPQISRIVQNLHATNVALFQQRREINRMRENGELAETDAVALSNEVNRKLKALYHRPMADWGVTGKQLARRRTHNTLVQQKRNCDTLRAAVGVVKLARRFQRDGEEDGAQNQSEMTETTGSNFVGEGGIDMLQMMKSMKNLNAALKQHTMAPIANAQRHCGLNASELRARIASKGQAPMADRRAPSGSSVESTRLARDDLSA